MEQYDANSFWRFATAWIGALTVYIAVSLLTDPADAETINNIAWTLAPIGALFACRATARTADLTPEQRRAWSTMALACGSWLVGQLIWDGYALVDSPALDLPNPSKVFYLLFAVLMVRALGGLSDSRTPGRFTMEHAGNLGLIACCLVVTIVVVFLEPVAQQPSTSLTSLVSLVHSSLVAATFFAALYYLWTQRWHATWAPMLLLVAAMGIYTSGNFIYAHALLTGTYEAADSVNVTWLAMFLLIALAARLRATKWASDSVTVYRVELMARRSRLLEAIVPALLIVMMVVVGMSAASQLSPRVLVATAALLLLFALILGTREAWVQGESQRLTLELRSANERLRGANVELQDSEARVRDLHAHLGERVAERTRQLELAYEELEGFAYAVAHDLKAPLRAIDGFGQLVQESLRDHADAEASGHLARIQRNATKMSSLIDDLLAYSRIERRAFVEQSIDLKQIIDAAVREHATEIERRRIEIAVDVPSLELSADAEALALVIRNLLQNALKFTRESELPRIRIRARRRSDSIELTVTDNGIGFDMQYHDQIFRLFHRLHRDDEYQGTGIGLALVRKALERMHGTVRAESEEGIGATFIVILGARSQI